LEYYQFVSLAFDTVGGGHPISIKVDGVEVFDDDAIFNFKLAKTTNSQHILEISNWNHSNSPLIISGIYSVVNAKIDRRSALRIDGSVSQRGDVKFPNYGVYSSGGQLEFTDKSGEYADYADLNLLSEGCQVELKLRNTLDKHSLEGDTVAVYYTTTWYYDDFSRTVSVQITDGLEILQNVQSNSIIFGGKVSMYEVYSRLKEISTPYIKFSELTYCIETRLKNKTMEDAKISQKTLWAQWNDFCVANELYMFSNNGEVEFSYNSNGD
jgi:hypothetical protein